MKHIKALFVVLLLIFMFGCQTESHSIPLSHSADRIARIELIEDQRAPTDPVANHVVICKIPVEQHEAFIADLLAMPASRSSLDPPTDFGWWIVRITYENGDVDMIGPDNNAYFSAKKQIFDCYCFNWEEFQEFFGKYVYDIVPDYVPQWQ